MSPVMKCALLCLAFFPGIALATVPEPPSGGPLFTALWRGDTAKVLRLEKQEGAGPGMRRLADAQLHYDIPRLLSAAQQCQAETFRDRAKGSAYLPTALLCNYIVRSSALIQGNARLYLQQTQWAKDTLFPALAKAFPHPGQRFGLGSGLDSVDLAKVINHTPAVSETWLQGSIRLGYVNQGPVSGWPGVKVKINGRVTTAAIMVNGGFPLRTPVVLVEPAHGAALLTTSLGLALVVRHYGSITVDVDSVPYSAEPSLFLADTVTVGPLILHHVAVGVIRSDFMPPGVYLQNAMWQRFGEVVLSDDQVRLSKRALNDCLYPTPLTFATGSKHGYEEVGELFFPAKLDGIERRTILSDRSDLVTVDAAVWSGEKASAVSKIPKQRSTLKGATQVQLGDQTFEAKQVHVESGWHEPYQVAIGLPILDRYAVHLRLSGGSPSICLTKDAGGAGDGSR